MWNKGKIQICFTFFLHLNPPQGAQEGEESDKCSQVMSLESVLTGIEDYNLSILVFRRQVWLCLDENVELVGGTWVWLKQKIFDQRCLVWSEFHWMDSLVHLETRDHEFTRKLLINQWVTFLHQRPHNQTLSSSYADQDTPRRPFNKWKYCCGLPLIHATTCH